MSAIVRVAFVVTCEHAVNRIPPRYQSNFVGRQALLDSHHGYDRGALTLARALARRLAAPLFHASVSRLLIDLNRSPGHRGLYGEAVRRLSEDERAEILARYYAPMRDAAAQTIGAAIRQRKRVVHFSVHSFTPVLHGIERNADIGLLYDPARRGEHRLCKAWQAELTAHDPQLRVRRNYPYAGKSDGFAAFLRKRHGGNDYLGIEIEINQRRIGEDSRSWAALRKTLLASLMEAIETWGAEETRVAEVDAGSSRKGGANHTSTRRRRRFHPT